MNNGKIHVASFNNEVIIDSEQGRQLPPSCFQWMFFISGSVPLKSKVKFEKCPCPSVVLYNPRVSFLYFVTLPILWRDKQGAHSSRKLNCVFLWQLTQLLHLSKDKWWWRWMGRVKKRELKYQWRMNIKRWCAYRNLTIFYPSWQKMKLDNF